MGSVQPPAEKKLIHLVGFTEATETINEPDSEYVTFSDDEQGNYVINRYENTSPIEAGEFYRYYDTSFPIIVDNLKLQITMPYNPILFDKNYFEWSYSYQSATDLPTDLYDSPQFMITANMLNMQYRENFRGSALGLYRALNESDKDITFGRATFNGTTGFFLDEQPEVVKFYFSRNAFLSSTGNIKLDVGLFTDAVPVPE